MSQEQAPNDPATANAAVDDAGAVDAAATAEAGADEQAGAGSFIGDAGAGDADGAADAAAADDDAAGDGDAGEAGDDPVDQPAEVAPYEGLTAPEGTELHEDDLAAAAPLMRAFNVPDDQAQAFLEQAAPVIGQIVNRSLEAAQASVLENRAQLTREWVAEIEADPEIGGANLDKSKALIAKARDALFDKDTVAFLAETGLGNHPGLARAMARMGAQLSEGSVHRGEGGQQKLTTAQKLYGEEFQPRR